jgi:hypothetical protein
MLEDGLPPNELTLSSDLDDESISSTSETTFGGGGGIETRPRANAITSTMNYRVPSDDLQYSANSLLLDGESLSSMVEDVDSEDNQSTSDDEEESNNSEKTTNSSSEGTTGSTIVLRTATAKQCDKNNNNPKISTVISSYKKQRKNTGPSNNSSEQIEIDSSSSRASDVSDQNTAEVISVHSKYSNREDLTCHTFDVDDVSGSNGNELKVVRTRRASRYVLLAQRTHRKRPRSEFQNSGEPSSLSTPGSRVTVHGARLSRVYLNNRGSEAYTVHQTLTNKRGSNVYSIKIQNQNKRNIYVLGMLPDELLVGICSWLEPEDLGRVTSVCKRWMVIAELDMLWETISYEYYPEETMMAASLRQTTDIQPSKKSLMQWIKRKSATEVPVRFYKDIFVKHYTYDVVMLKTGIWKNPTWRPKKSPWSKEDYLFVHNTMGSKANRSGSVPIKVVVVGDGAVGKTSLLCRYANKYFPEDDFLPTIFDNFSTQTIYLNQAFTISLWDTAGPEDYDRLR